MTHNQILIAQAIAHVAHRGQVDKLGEPYIEHCKRVADRLIREDWAVLAGGWLHDVLEDTEVTLDDLRAAGVEETVCSIVNSMTHFKGDTNEEYWAQVKKQGWGARKVKLADIADNTDVRRLAQLDEETSVRLIKKYARALNAIQGDTPAT